MKLDCPAILKLLKSDYLDNELDPAAREQVEQHLAQCPACRGSKEKLVAISRIFRQAARAEIPETLWPRIQAQIRPARMENRPASRPNFRGYIFAHRAAFSLAAAAMLVLAGIGFLLEINRAPAREAGPTLGSLLDNDLGRAPNMNFGSHIENYLL